MGAIVDLLEQFKQQLKTLLMPKMPDGSFAKKLFSLYLTYLPKEKFSYPLKMNVDPLRNLCIHRIADRFQSISVSRDYQGAALAQQQMGAFYCCVRAWLDSGTKY